MKILHVTDSYTPFGGIEQYIIALIAQLQKGHNNLVVYRHNRLGSIENGPCPSICISPEEYSDGGRKRLRQIIQDEAIDLAYVHAVYEPFPINVVAESVPTVAYLHGFPPVCPGLAKYFHRGDRICTRPFGPGCIPAMYLHRCSDVLHPLTVNTLWRTARDLKMAYQALEQIIVASRYMQDLLVQNGFRTEKITIIPPHFVFPIEFIEPDVDHPTLLFAGRLEIEKGLPYLLEALKRTRNPCKLYVAGDGTCRSDYEALTRKMGLENRVVYLGWLDKAALDEIYKQTMLVALTSVFPEPFGKVGIEAMMQGRPVVAFNVGGVSDWLLDGVNGYLVFPRDVDALADRIDLLISDRELSMRMGRQAQEFVIHRFSAEDHLSRLFAVFGATLRSSRDRQTANAKPFYDVASFS